MLLIMASPSLPDDKNPSISIEELKKRKEKTRILKDDELPKVKSDEAKVVEPKSTGWEKFSIEHPVLKYLYDFFFLIVVYGFLLNFALMVILKIPLSPINSLGFGVAFYFIKEEMPRIIQRSLIRRAK